MDFLENNRNPKTKMNCVNGENEKMILILQLFLYCLIFFLMVKFAAGNNGINCLYFYPKSYQEKAIELGLADEQRIKRKGKAFMVPFLILLLLALVGIISVWNQVKDFKTAYWQAVLFLIVMNWFDGIVIDRIWVGHSRIWAIPEMKGVPYIKSWKDIFLKRGIATILYLIIALGIAEIVVLLGKV